MSLFFFRAICRAVGRRSLFVLPLEIEGGLKARGIFDLFITHLVDMAWVQGR